MFKGIRRGKVYGREQGVLNAILVYLRASRIPCAKVRNTGAMFQDRTGGLRFRRPAVMQRGVADVLAAYKGRPVAIEVKAADGRLSDDQREWLRDWEGSVGRGAVIVARDVEDVIQGLSRIDRGLL